MPRTAKLGKKNGQWHTKAGNPNGVYFGSVDTLSYAQAKQLFAAHLHTLGTSRRQHASGLSVAELIDSFLDWAQAKRSERTYDERKRHLDRFANYPVDGTLLGEVAATSIKVSDLESFLEYVGDHDYVQPAPEVWQWVERVEPLDPFTVGKYMTSVAACFAWGAGKGNPSPCLPRDFHPFAGFERHKRPPEPLLEGELPTLDEVRALFNHADDDLMLMIDNGRYCTRLPEDFRDVHEYAGFGDLLKVYHQTGARTSELAVARVSHFVKGARQIVLSNHKRAKTMKEVAARRLTLTDEAFEIVEKLCRGRKGHDPIFTDPKGRPWDRYTLGVRFKQVRQRAGVRDGITIYSFRHLWISDALMSGVDVATVAKMAGTSIAMVEKVYGHYTNTHFADAQNVVENARKARLALSGAA